MTGVRESVAWFAAHDPGLPAVRSGPTELTYRELDERGTRVTRYLRSHGVRPGDRVVIDITRGQELHPAVLGVLGAGAAFVPVDTRAPRHRARRITEDCGAVFALTDHQALPRYRGLSGVQVRPVQEALASAADSAPSAPPAALAGSGWLAYVLYTSGSTGSPKGVAVSSEAMTRYLDWACAAYRMAEGTGAPLFTSVGFDATLTTLLGPLLAGRTVTLLPETNGDELFQLADVLCTAPDFSLLKAAPQQVDLLSDILEGRPLSGATRRLVVGGEALRGETVRRWSRVCPATPVINEYGPTETVVGCTAHTVLPTEIAALPTNVPIGEPVAGAAVHLLSPAGEPVGPGVVGEIYVAGSCAQNMYLGRPGLTAQRFVPDPWGTPGSRMYRTGDLARHNAHGQLEYRGRTDRQVKVRGVRLELDEIEEEARGCPSVSAVSVVVWRDAQGETVLGAAVAGTTDVVDRLREHLREHFMEHAVPQRLERVAALPLNRHGKTDLAAVTELLRAPAQGGAGTMEQGDAVQRTVARFMAEVLARGEVASDDDFFALGGDSISGIRLVAKLGKEGFVLRPRDVVECPTPLTLAARLAARTDTDAPSARRGVVAGQQVPLTPVQREFFALGLDPASHWNQHTLLRVPRGGSRQDLATAVRHICERHDVFGYRYRRTGDSWRQEYVGGPPSVVVSEYVPDSPQADVPTVLRDVARTAHGGLDLSEGPLARVVLVRGEDEDHVVMVAHHLVVDAVSWTVLLDDLVAYVRANGPPEGAHGEATGVGEPPAVPEGPAFGSDSFAHWSETLERFARRPEVRARSPYWRDVLAAESGAVHRPASGDDYAYEQYEAGCLSTKETRALEEAADHARLQLQEVLLGAAVRTICDVLAVAPPRVDVESHGRADDIGDLDISRTVGWFTSVFPVAFTKGSGLLDLVGEARRSLRDAPWHGLDFGALHDALGHGPQQRSQVLFNFLGRTQSSLAADLDWHLVDLAPGTQVPPAGPRPYHLELQARVVDGALTWYWVYGRHHTPETARRLSGGLRESLLVCAAELGRSRTLRFGASGLPADELNSLIEGFDGALGSGEGNIR